LVKAFYQDQGARLAPRLRVQLWVVGGNLPYRVVGAYPLAYLQVVEAFLQAVGAYLLVLEAYRLDLHLKIVHLKYLRY
jgi:hypothetical protein